MPTCKHDHQRISHIPHGHTLDRSINSGKYSRNTVKLQYKILTFLQNTQKRTYIAAQWGQNRVSSESQVPSLSHYMYCHIPYHYKKRLVRKINLGASYTEGIEIYWIVLWNTKVDIRICWQWVIISHLAVIPIFQGNWGIKTSKMFRLLVCDFVVKTVDHKHTLSHGYKVIWLWDVPIDDHHNWSGSM